MIRQPPAGYLLILFPVLGFLAAGCEGPEGPPGEGIGSTDLRPPEIQWVRPAPNDTIYAAIDTFEVEASDNDSVDFVEFYVDGSSDLGETGRAVAETSPYILPWDFLVSGHGRGLHILSARAVDMSGNITWASPIPLWLLPLFGTVELGYDYQAPDGMGIMKLPNEFGDRYWNVRFTPRTECTIVALYFYFIQPVGNGLNGGVDIDIYFWESEDYRPAEERASFRVTKTDITYDTWWEYNLSDQALTFSEDFHAGWSPVEELYDAYLDSVFGLWQVVSITETDLLKEEEKHRSLEYNQATGWLTVQESYNIKYDFKIRALVDYGNGPVTMLKPAPIPGEPESFRRIQRNSLK